MRRPARSPSLTLRVIFLAVSLPKSFTTQTEWTHAMSIEALAPPADLHARKQHIREQAHANRNAQPDKDEISRRIVASFMAQPEYSAARTVMFYVDVRSEVRTRNDLAAALETGKKIVVPYCVDGELELFHLESMDELELGMYRILEPKSELRSVAAKRVEVEELDLIMVPGVAFDRRGGRAGHGKGYYDKLLEHARPDTPLIALAFECQLFPEIPMQPHDIFMDKVVTESAVSEGLGRRGFVESPAPSKPR
jgi:5-formyltetrahydrofolate cyclo-ligase